MKPTEIISNSAIPKDNIILFHSGTGKDSIVLLDMCSKVFEKITCVFMYIVPGLEYEARYIRWAEAKYPNAKFIKTPHYCVYSFIKNGYLGIQKDDRMIKMSISKIDEKVRKKTGIQQSMYGFKKVDGITRRLMLNDCPSGIHEKTRKIYPLMDWTNKNCLEYIAHNSLIQPFNYGTTKPSSGCDISTPEFLAYLKKMYPEDLERVAAQYPMTKNILFRYEQLKAE